MKLNVIYWALCAAVSLSVSNGLELQKLKLQSSEVVITLLEVEVFSISGRKLELKNPQQSDTHNTVLVANNAIDGHRKRCVSPVSHSAHGKSDNYWQADVEYHIDDPIGTINIYPSADCSPDHPEYYSRQRFKVLLGGVQKYEVKHNEIRDAITIKVADMRTQEWKLEISNRIYNNPIVLEEIEVFRKDGTKIPIRPDSQSQLHGYSTVGGINDGIYKTKDNCGYPQSTIMHTKGGLNHNYWRGTILNGLQDRVAKIVIHGRVRKCAGLDRYWTSARYDVYLNGVLVYKVTNIDQVPNNLVTLLFEPVEVFNSEFGQQIQLQGIVPLFNQTSGLEIPPVLFNPEQSGYVEPFIPAHGIDERFPGDCNDNTTCALTGTGERENFYKAVLVSELKHQVSGLKVVDNSMQGEDEIHALGSSLKFRNKITPLDAYETGHEFVVETPFPNCKCTEESNWFACPVGDSEDESKVCTLTNIVAPSRNGEPPVCGQGFVGEVTAAYLPLVEAALADLKDATKNSLTYRTRLLDLIDLIVCVQLPLREALSAPVTKQLLNAAFKMLESLDKYRPKPITGSINPNEIDEPILNTLADVLRSQSMKIAYPEPVLEGTRRLPLYSMERVLSLPDALNSWEFFPESKWTQRLQELSNQIQQPENSGAFCNTLFDGLQSDAQTEANIALTNLNEIAEAIDALNKRVKFSQSGLEETTKLADKSATDLNEAITTMKEKIEEYRQAKLSSDIFNAIVNVVVAVGAVVAAAAATIVTGGSTAAILVGAGLFLAEAIGPVVEIVEAGVEIHDAAQELNDDDEASLVLLTEAGYDIDQDEFSFQNKNFNSNVKAISKELQVLADELVAFLTEAGKNPESVLSNKIRETKMNPLVWDNILLQMTAQLESMNICVPPDISEIRRLSDANTSPMSQGLQERRAFRGEGTVDGEKFERSLGDKAGEEREAAKESIVDMQQKCKVFMLNFAQVTNYGKMIHMDLIELSSLVREYRTAAFATGSYAQSVKSWEDNKATCADMDSAVETYKALLHTQFALAEMMKEQDISAARSRLVMVCETIDYILNPAVSVCDLKSVYGLQSIQEINSHYELLKQSYERKWTSRINAKSESFHSLDVTHLVDLKRVQEISGSSNTTDFEFVLTPDDIPDGHMLKCHSNVEMQEVAVVFGGVDEDGYGSYSTNAIVSGPFLKQQSKSSADTEAALSVFLPRKAYKLLFQYEMYKDDTCKASTDDMTKICDRKLCRVSSGGNQDLASGTVALPTLYASYRVQVTQLGKSGLKAANSVHLVYKGRWTQDDDVKCVTENQECSWYTPTFPTELVVGAVLGGIAVGGAVVGGIWWSKKSSASSNGNGQVMVAEDYDDKIASPRFSL